MSRMIVADVSSPAAVYGVHGAAGLTYWSCLTRRAGLDGDWEAIEWASVPPGGISGEHLHSRTEEIYFILSGTADFVLDGVAHRVTAGHLGLTAVGSRHALHNAGDEPVNWLVIEMLSPHTAAAVRGRPAPDLRRTMGSTVLNLRDLRSVDPRQAFTGPLESIKLTTLDPGESVEVVSAGREHTLFLLSGSATATSGVTRVPLAVGSSVTLPLRAAATLQAGPEGAEFFQATMVVDGTR
ncbi:cupin domain-containing protein [Catellatospora citrea]|uniref:cupin domain-containing protein n=1 Tax=Catellatospora citrea TaxID=53366 RepID=UPI00340A7DD6